MNRSGGVVAFKVENRSPPSGYVRRSPTKIGETTFILKFDSIFRSANDRLRYCDSVAACGQWNATLIDDFRCDSEFIRTADELFDEVVGQNTNGECITSDGLSLETARIDLGNSIELYFRLHYLEAPNGYGIAPAKFSVATDTTRHDCSIGTLCCGLREPDGNFWYPPTSQMPNVVIPDDYDWAYSQTRVYGEPTISSWIDRRHRKREEQ